MPGGGTTSTSVNPGVLGVPTSSTPSTTDLGVPSSSESSTSVSSDTATTSTSAALVHSVSSTSTTPSATSVSSTSTTPSGTSTHKASASESTSNGVSPGATAGIAIGCFLAGSLIALALALMWFRQRSTRRRGPRGGGGFAHGTRSEKRKEHGVEVYEVAATQERNIDDVLPHEADDKTIRQKVSTLLDQLELHVENFYSDVPVQIDPDMERQLSRFSTPLLSEPLAALLNSTSRPTTLIKHCLVFYVLNLTSSSPGSSGSLLPPQIVDMHRAVAKTQERDPLDSNTTFAFSRWRALTAFLRPELLSETNSLLDTTAPGRAAVSDAVATFSRTFHPWSSPEHPATERERHMANLLRGAAALGTWLFSQTSSFEFDWEPPKSVEPRERSNSRVAVVVVVPGLLKTVDSKGVLLVRRVRILEGVVKRV